MTTTIKQFETLGDDVITGEAIVTVSELGNCVSQVVPVSPSDPTRSQWMRLAETSRALSFWNHPEEDIYSDSDGEPA